MHPVIEWTAAILIVIAAFFLVVGAIGLARLPDFYMRLHAPTKASTLGVGGVLIASMLVSAAPPASSAPRMSESVVAAPGMLWLINPALRARLASSVVLTRLPLCPNATPVPAAVLRNTGCAFSHVVDPVVE